MISKGKLQKLKNKVFKVQHPHPSFSFDEDPPALPSLVTLFLRPDVALPTPRFSLASSSSAYCFLIASYKFLPAQLKTSSTDSPVLADVSKHLLILLTLANSIARSKVISL